MPPIFTLMLSPLRLFTDTHAAATTTPMASRSRDAASLPLAVIDDTRYFRLRHIDIFASAYISPLFFMPLRQYALMARRLQERVARRCAAATPYAR